MRLRRGGTWLFRVAVTATSLLAISGCNSGKDEIPGPQAASPTTTGMAAPPSTSTSGQPAADPEAEVRAAYLRFWDARFAANLAAPDPSAPALDQVATGAQLGRTTAELEANRDAGIAFRRPSPSVARRKVDVDLVDSGTATIHDCAVNDGIVYRVATGEIVSSSVSTRSLDAVMKHIGGSWLLESTSVVQEWEGVAGCALAS